MTNNNVKPAGREPNYFQNLLDTLVDEGMPVDRQALALMVTSLHNLGCTQETIERLCIQGAFGSWESLIVGRYSFRDYHELGISVPQVRLLVEGIKQPLKGKKLLSDKADCKSLRWFLIKCICEKRQRTAYS